MIKQKPNPEIKTYNTETFRNRYMQPGEKLDAMLKNEFGKFFITRVEDMIRLIKLPVPPMRATSHSLIYLTAGEAVMSVGNETYTVYKDECLLVPAGQLFSFNNVDENKGHICHFHNDFIMGKSGKPGMFKSFAFLNVWSNPRIVLGKEASAYAHQLLKRIFKSYTAHGLGQTDILQSYFIALLCEINNQYAPPTQADQPQSVSLANRFRELLFAHIKTEHRVSAYAAQLNVSPNYLNKVVKSVTGKSPAKWIDETLVLEAKALLYQTGFSISRVAAETGIYDQSYFSRLFKKHEGITPLQFRRRIEKS